MRHPTELATERASADHFRPDVEGLRAVAVLLVLFYHAQVPFFGGGYVGVDVFFVISGFLITGLILRELETTGRLSITGFYSRRARRLLPAAALTLLVTLAASVVLLSAVRIPDVATDIASAAAYVSNFRFGIQANDYFAANAAPSPVLHFWSLSVEEQFYLFWPTLMVALFWLSGRLRAGRRGLFAGIALVSALSLVVCVWLTGQNQPWAFFLLPTRAWELGLGALLAVSLGRLPAIRPRIAAAIVIAGLAAIALADLVLNDASVFPGVAAILPVAGAGLVILGGLGKPLPAKLLALPPFTFLGRVSYSIYLWHWPMLVFAAVLYGSALPLWLSVLVAAASIPVAALTQRLIEQPFRVGRLIGIRPRWNLSQALASSLTLVLLCAGATVYSRRQVDGSLAGLTPSIANIDQFDPRGWCTDPADLTTCAYGVVSSATTVVIFGDSLAAQWFPAIEEVASQQGWRLVALARGWCPSADVDVINGDLNRVEPECRDWREKAFARIAAEHPDLVIVTNHRWQPVVDGQLVQDQQQQAQLWQAGLERTLARLTTSAKAVAVLGETPATGGPSPATCLPDHPGDFAACARSRSIVADRQSLEIDAAGKYGATFIDPTRWMCQGDTCPAVIGSYIAYMDTTHITSAFAASLAPDLQAALAPLVGPGEPVASAPVLVTTLKDTFSRSLQAGWGQPDVGPDWASDASEVQDSSVDGAVGKMSVQSANGGLFERVDVAGTDTDVLGRWALAALPVGGPIALHFWPRVVDANDYYGFYLSIDAAGEIFATGEVTSGGQSRILAGPVLVASDYATGDWRWVRAEAFGVNPTSLRIRVWKDGTAEPSEWTLDFSDATAAVQASANTVQLGISMGDGQTLLPYDVGFDDITISSSP